jgi:histidine triad (HIT) family protein
MSDCLFCKIINKEIPADIIFEDDNVLAFRDINPQAPVHILVIPKKHISNTLEIEKEDSKILPDIFDVINKLVKKESLDKDGFRIVNNCGERAGQSVFHIHFHLLGGRAFQWPPG